MARRVARSPEDKRRRVRIWSVWMVVICLLGGCWGVLLWPLVELYVPPPGPPGYHDLIKAIDSRDAHSVARILISGVNPNAFPDSKWARTQYADVTPLSEAATVGDPSTVKLLLDAGADPNGFTGSSPCPLETAAEAGNVAVLNVLIQSGARVNNTEAGSSALWSAATESHTDAVKFLLDKGADPNSSLTGHTLIAELRKMKSDPAIIKLLENAGGKG